MNRFSVYQLISRGLGILVVIGAVILPACNPPQDELNTGFKLELSSQTVVLTPGGSADIGVKLIRTGNSDSVDLSITGIPSDVTASFDKTSVSGDEAILTIATSEQNAPVEADFTVHAKSPSQLASADAKLSIQRPEEPEEGYEEFAPGVKGELKTITVNGQEFEYEVINGLAIFDGDMVLGDARTLESLEHGLQTASATCNFGFHTEFACSRWDNGVIGYSIANNWGSEANNQEMRNRIQQAIAHWEANTSIRFVRRSSGQYLEFRNGSGCSSTVGRAVITGFDSQSISLSTRCTTGSVIHEIGHAVGLYHEHSRDDRNDHVVVDFGRVQDFRLHNFFQWGEYERDVGAYDYDSIMHYPKWAFARNRAACVAGNLGECTIRPKNGIDPDRIGQRTGLSDGDILGAYTLYPPDFVIEGATAGQRSDRFFLSVDFSTPNVRADYIRWTSNRVEEELGSGYLLTMRSSDLDSGEHIITASVVINSVTVVSKSISLTLANDAPSVSIAANNGQLNQHLNQVFTVSSSVSDTEDGACAPEICRYVWSPEPHMSPFNSTVANYQFTTEGVKTITLSVEDSSGAISTDSISFTVVNTPPEVNIIHPSSNVSQATGTTLRLEAAATDINTNTGELACSALSWTSSNPSDSFSTSGGTGCDLTVTLGTAGLRTLTVTASDAQGASHSDSVSVSVTACEGNCKPSALLTLDTPPDFTAGGYPGYYHTTVIAMTASGSDADGVEDYPLSYTVTQERVPCIGGCPETTLTSGTFSAPAQTRTLSWQPITTCTDRHIFEAKLYLTDSRGASNQAPTQTVIIDCNLF